MFGNEYDIVRYFPEYFLDYRENPDTVIRWTGRLQFSSGEWSGNLFDFYFRVYNKIIKDIKVPFKMQGGFRVNDTPVHISSRWKISVISDLGKSKCVEVENLIPEIRA